MATVFDATAVQQAVNILLANLSEEARKSFEIYYDAEAKDVTLTRLDEAGQETTVTRPNVAKLVQRFSRNLTPPVRQAVLAGRTTNGLPDWLDIAGNVVELDASETSPFLAAFAAGMTADEAPGPVDYVEAIVADMEFTNLTASSTCHLYIARSAADGSLSTGHSTLKPAWGPSAPSAPADGQHWFDSIGMAMKVYDSTAAQWTTVQRLFVGQAETGADGTPTAVTCEPLMRGESEPERRGAYPGLGPTLIRNARLSVMSRATPQEVGGNILSGGDFASADGWTLGAGWSIAGGVATATDVTGGSSMSKTVVTVPGRYYRVSVDCTSYTEGYLLLSGAGYNSPYKTGTGTHSFVFKAKDVSSFCKLLGTGTPGLDATFDNMSVLEVAPGCVGDDDYACDGHVKSTSLRVLGVHDDPDHVQGLDGLLLTKGSSNDEYYTLVTASEAESLAKAWKPVAGRTRPMSLGCYVYASAVDLASLEMADDNGQSASPMAPAGTLHWLEICRWVEDTITTITPRLRLSGAPGATCYLSPVMLAPVERIGEGSFVPMFEESIWFPEEITSQFEVSGKGTTNMLINVPADALGALGRGITAAAVRFNIRDIASSTYDAKVGVSGRSNTVGVMSCAGLANNQQSRNQFLLPPTPDGDLTLTLNASGTASMDITALRYLGVTI